MSESRRKRLCAPAEQREFARVGRQLVASGMSVEELRSALGFPTLDGMRRALENGRVTHARLDKLRALAARLKKEAPDAETPKIEGPAVMSRIFRAPSAAKLAPRPADGAAQPKRRAEAERDQLQRAKHHRLRDHVDQIQAVDGRLRDWSLLARAAGLGGGQAMKDAYESGPPADEVVRNLELFQRLHAAFASRATLALDAGVSIEALQEHLMSSKDGDGASAATGEASEGSQDDSATHANDTRVRASEMDMQDSEESREEAARAGDSRPTSRRRVPPGRKKEHLTEGEHARLRGLLDELRARDPGLRNWSFLAKVAGLRSGFAIKRAYDVNSSRTTLRNVQGFAKLHERHGKAAIRALKDGVTRDQLDAHLEGRSGGKAAEKAPAASGGGASSAGAASMTPGTATPAAPRSTQAEPAPVAVDFARMIELGQAIDAEVHRLLQAAHLFDSVAHQAGMPRIVRSNAALARDRLRGVIELFTADGEPGSS